MQTLNSSRKQSWLAWFYKGLLFLASFVLLTRVAELQIIKGKYFRSLSEDNRIRRVPILAPRGKIIARNGEIIADNKEYKFTVNFTPLEGFQKLDISESTPADEILSESHRLYPLEQRTAHLSGYISEVNQDEVAKIDPVCPDKGIRLLGSIVGRSGLEAFYDCQLRGINGEELVEVDTFGQKIRLIGRKEPIPGQDLHTTIDYSLQKIISSRLLNKKGAILATTPNGEVLALYSSPSFDPNAFIQTNPADSDKLSAYFSDENLPLFNRVISGKFHPGSLFKIVTSVAALEESAIDASFEYEDTGVIKVDEYEYKNWYFTQYGGQEGLIDLTHAIARSTDTFFYKVGEYLGAEKLSEWAIKFGLANKTGIDLPGEVEGLVPSPQWKKAIKGERWYLGNTYHMSIGQGDLSVNVAEVNQIAQIIAANGQYCIPHIKQQSPDCHNLDISKPSIEAVKKGMIGACSTGGTAYPFFEFSPQAACKTGTAETFKEDVTHAWFTVMAPAENPEIILTILVEEGGEGSKEAAPIAYEILDYWFHNRTQ